MMNFNYHKSNILHAFRACEIVGKVTVLGVDI